MTIDPIMFVIGLPAASILRFGSFRYAMTAIACRIRLCGHRIATSLLVVGGGVLLGLSALKPALVCRAAYLTSAIRKSIKARAAGDPLEALCRLPTRLDFR
jgi:hypothetical protein